MTHLSKTVIALLLLAGGFVAAKTFGPPDLAERLVKSWRPDPAATWGDLRPAEHDDHQAEFLAPLDAVEMPASFSSAYTHPESPPAPATTFSQPTFRQPPAPRNDWPTPPTLSVAPQGVTPSAYEGEMVPLRAAPLGGQEPQPWETAKPARDPWSNAPPVNNARDGNYSPTTFEPWGAQSNAAAAPSQFAGYSPQPFTAPVTPPALWQSEPEEPLTPLAPPNAEPGEELVGRTHIVTDGDSLPRLAQRYLGDESRSGEIFERNRDLLTHPDLLPLGVELQLP